MPGGPIDPSCRLVTPLAGVRAAAAGAGVRVGFAPGCDIDTNSTTGSPHEGSPFPVEWFSPW